VHSFSTTGIFQIGAIEPHEIGTKYNDIRAVKKAEYEEIRKYGWQKEINISGKVVEIKEDAVLCDCLLDPEAGIFEIRNFPRMLFNHLHSLASQPYVYITIRTRPGTTRIDVLDGARLVNKTAFEIKEAFNASLFKSINKPLKSTIVINAKD
jgi:hypothetical protein